MLQVHEPLQALPVTANLGINLIMHTPTQPLQVVLTAQIKSLGEVLFVDSSLFSYGELAKISRVGKEWRQLAERGMQQLPTLSLPHGGNVSLHAAKRTFSPKLLHIDLHGSTFCRGTDLWLFMKQATELCPNLQGIDQRHCDGTGLTQVVVFVTKQHCEQETDSTMGGGNFYSHLLVSRPYGNSEKSHISWAWAMLRDTRLGPRIFVDEDFVPSGDALSAAVRQKEPDTVSMLLALIFRSREGAISFTVRDTHIFTAAMGRQISMVDVLVEVGGDVNSVNMEGVTPALLATENGNMRMVNLLRDRGARMDVLRGDGVGIVALTFKHGHENLLGLSKQIMGCGAPEHKTANDIRSWAVEIVSAFMTPFWIESRLSRIWREMRDGDGGLMRKQLSFIIGIMGRLVTLVGNTGI